MKRLKVFEEASSGLLQSISEGTSQVALPIASPLPCPQDLSFRGLHPLC